MKVLKIVGITLLAIIVILLLVALFMPKDYSVAGEVVINKPRQEVFNYIKYVRNQDNYSKWNMADPAMKKSYAGTDGTVGFVYSWESEKMGVGQQAVTSIAEGSRVDMDLTFIKPWESKAKTFIATEDAGANQTKVTWGFSGHSPWPMNLMSFVIKSDLQTGMNNLKAVMEK